MRGTNGLRASVIAGAILAVGACGVEPEPEVESQSAELTAGSALLIVGNANLNAGDLAVRDRLQALGLTVVIKADTAAKTSDATGKRVILISSTLTSSSVNSKYKAVTVPVMVWESSLLDDMGMTANANGPDFGTSTKQKQLSIVAPATDPMAAGLSGKLSVTSANSTFSWGKPSAAAVVIARLASDAQKSAIFRYDTGAQMTGMTAPARRVGFFLEDTTASVLTPAGQALTDAAIRWAVGTSKVNGAACSSSSECTSGVCADGICCATTCIGACRSCALPGTEGTCALVAASQFDPHGVCVDASPRTCGANGFCDGAGACQLYPAGTACAAATCKGATFTSALTCNGVGVCQSGSSFSCAPYVCSSWGSCGSFCTTNADCVAPAACINGTCQSSCTPVTCAAQGRSCGLIPNGCGGTLNCGACTPPQTCGGSGTPNVCGCTPTTCALQRRNCGTIPDGCGGVLICGACAAPESCGGSGIANVCGCTPTSCAAQGKNCGNISDGCGGTLNCGVCTLPELCGGAGATNVCGCTALTNCPGGKNCGAIPNGCGGVLGCGTCPAPQSCGGSGIAGVCGCTPTTCAAQGKNCGNISDGCGGTLSCGACTAPQTCGVANFCG